MADEPVQFATVEDLKARWPDFPTGGETQAGALLIDASQMILDTCSSAMNASENTRKRIVCAVVRRSMQGEQSGAFDVPGLESWNATAGPMSWGGKFSNPNGDLYLTAAEKAALGCGKQRAGSVNLLAGREPDRVLP